MKIPQFKSKRSFLLGKKPDLQELRRIDYRSRIMLYFSKMLLLVGIFLIVLDNLDYFTPGTYFGAYSWTTEAVLAIGIFISFFSIPYLYFSSYKRFVSDDDFWDEEVFWLLPLFFFGTFFQYGSGIMSSDKILFISLLIIFSVHSKFMLNSRHLAQESDNLAGRYQYFNNLTYLTIYYLIFLGLFFAVNPADKLQLWMEF